jgi:hypothetical protein
MGIELGLLPLDLGIGVGGRRRQDERRREQQRHGVK